MNKPKFLIIHHEGASNGFYSVNAWHKEKAKQYHKENYNTLFYEKDYISKLGFFCLYHYYIDKSGKVYQARLDEEEGGHLKGMNNVSLGICLMGNFNKDFPTKEQEDALRKLLIEKMDKFTIKIDNIYPHRHFAKTDCYGLLIENNWLKDLISDKIKEEITDMVKVEKIEKQISIIEKIIIILTKLRNLKLWKHTSSVKK